jgi:hypothetical protein
MNQYNKVVLDLERYALYENLIPGPGSSTLIDSFKTTIKSIEADPTMSKGRKGQLVDRLEALLEKASSG